MNNKRMSLAEFKANADNVEVIEAMEAIYGGGLFNCHGKSGRFGKRLRDAALKFIGETIEESIA